MVTKLSDTPQMNYASLILAKIHMVTKLSDTPQMNYASLILAKIHMVTKPQIHIIIYLINYKL